MTIQYKWVITSAVAFALLASAILAAPVHADHAWGGYHWARTTNTFTIKLGDNVNSSWDAYLLEASNDWNTPRDGWASPSIVRNTIVPGLTNSTKGRNTPKNCTPTSGRVEVCNALYGSTGWLGIASIWASGSHITQGTVKLNDTYFRTSTYNKAAWKALVACQEVAHTFGLGHQDEVFNNPNLGSCMDYTNDPDGTISGQLSNRLPNYHDFEELSIIYGSHLDTSNSFSQIVVSSGADVDSNDPSAWGRETHRSQDGRVSVFEKDLGGGNKVIRHVFWVEDRAHGHQDQ